MAECQGVLCGLDPGPRARQDYVRYTFTFWEDNDRYREQLEPVRPEAGGGGQTAGGEASEAAVYHTVVSGETLWGIARAWGMTLGELLVLNPQIKNPNVIQPGQRLRVRG